MVCRSGPSERVSWKIFAEISKSITFGLRFRYKKAKILVYTGDTDATPKQIISKCRNNFNIHFDPERIEFVFLTQRKWVEAEKYPVMTMLGQSLGSIVLGFEALLKFQPDIFIDTMGKASLVCDSKSSNLAIF